MRNYVKFPDTVGSHDSTLSVNSYAIGTPDPSNSESMANKPTLALFVAKVASIAIPFVVIPRFNIEELMCMPKDRKLDRVKIS